MKKVLVFGTFDNLHKGHLDFFKQAKSFGDYLIVVVARDKNALAAKKYLPLQNENTRLEKVAAADLVDRAILGSPTMNYHQTLRRQKPAVLCLGYDQKPSIKELKKNLKDHNMGGIKIIRLKPYKPGLYKSSFVRKKYDSS